MYILASFPGLRPDFISQPWRKFSPRLRDKVWAEAWERGYVHTTTVSAPPYYNISKKWLCCMFVSFAQYCNYSNVIGATNIPRKPSYVVTGYSFPLLLVL